MNKNNFLGIAAILGLLAVLIAGSVFLFGKGKSSEQTKPQIKSLEAKSNTNTTETLGKVEKPKLGEINLLFVGDLMFDRHIRQKAEKLGNDFVFEKIKGLLGDNDLVIANLEGPITDNDSVSISSRIGERNNFIFTFDKDLTKTLFDNNIKLVNIGNNHIMNFGLAGWEQTEKNLDEAGIEYFGDVENMSDPAIKKEDQQVVTEKNNPSVIKNVGEKKIGFVNYNQFSVDSGKRALENIRNLKNNVDVTIVFTHWGTEYELEPNEKDRILAHQFVDEGADLVIGTHPHVQQSKEEYHGKMIYYCLGNFIFDQYFSPETKKGLAVKVKISPDRKLEFQDIGLTLDSNGQTRVAN